MASRFPRIADWPDEQLIAEVKRLAAVERRTTAALISALVEFDARRLYLGLGYSSLYTYCVEALHLAEGAAYNRIETARAARRFPIVLDGLEEGSLTVTNVRLLAPHLTAENHALVLASARYKRKREIEQLVASLSPRPDVQPVIRRLPSLTRNTEQPDLCDSAPPACPSHSPRRSRHTRGNRRSHHLRPSASKCS